jgi:IS1 family transposase/transposase-like protein
MKPIVCSIVVSLIVSFTSSDSIGIRAKGIHPSHPVLEQLQRWPVCALDGTLEVWAEWLCPGYRRGRWRWYRLWQVLYRLGRRHQRRAQRWRRWWEEWRTLLNGKPEIAPPGLERVGECEPMSVSSPSESVLSTEAVVVQPVEGTGEAKPPRRGRGRPREIETGHVACPREACRAYGAFGDDPRHDIVGCGAYSTEHGEVRQLFLCKVCGQTFSETAGTPFFGLETPMRTVCIALQELAEGLGVRAVARIHAVEPDTVLAWLRKAGQHCDRVSAFMMQELEVSQVQLDELWTFVRKKERMLSEWEKLHTEYGDTWIWTAFDPVNKLVLAVLIGERTRDEAVSFMQRLCNRLAEACLPSLTSDALPHYAQAILRVLGVWVQPKRKGKRGPHPKPRQVEPDGLNYAVVHKQREKGRVVSVTTKVVYGCMQDILACLEPLGHTINTSFVERMNLTLRHLLSRLHRKTSCFSKKRAYLSYHLHLGLAYYHFCRSHIGLRERLAEPVPTRGNGSPKLWTHRTPAMAAALTDHVWSIQELLMCRVPSVATP